MPVYGHAEKPD